ncbi:MAG: hypothetical protein HC934_07650 [Acaryochloridaceae cyanobacterium SU_2_1]|nr:hypothetical protein [Acaryochloridaceae cyanobacterium SU_2_1]
MIQHIDRADSIQQLANLQDLIEQLQHQEQFGDLVNCALQFLKAEFDYPLVWMALYEPQHSELVGLGGSFVHTDPLTQTFPLLPGDLLDQVLLTQQPIEVMNLQEESRVGKWQKLAQRSNIQGTLLYPILYRQASLGVLMIGSTLGVVTLARKKHCGCLSWQEHWVLLLRLCKRIIQLLPIDLNDSQKFWIK